MHFDIKITPLLFQKAMIKVFESMLQFTLIYIDDVLLFLQDEESHVTLLKQLVDIVRHHGIMLTESKVLNC
jgi:trans-aconitate methyltransferase